MNPAWVLPAFVGLWAGIMLVVSWLGGWAELARVYRPPRPFNGRRWWFQSASMRYRLNYGLCLIVGANAQGLSLSILLPFRPGHPPLFVPWSDITVASQKSRAFPYSLLGFGYVELRFRRAPSVPLRIMQGLGRRLAQSAGPAWPGPREEP